MASRDFQTQLKARAAAAGAAVPAHIVEPLETYLHLLARWNARINLTALPLQPPTSATIDRLFVEPLLAAPLIARMPRPTGRWFDLGSGGGSPAIPLRLLHAEGMLTLVESKSRKAAFLREVVRELGLPRTEVEIARVEACAAGPESRGTADLVSLRGVRTGAPLLEAIRTLLVGGRGCVLLFGAVDPAAAFAPDFTVLRAVSFLSGKRRTVIYLLGRPASVGPQADGSKEDC
jgi:16S rRNA (guanine527-N7)-methyltransferase